LPFRKTNHGDLVIIFKRNSVPFSTDYENHQRQAELLHRIFPVDFATSLQWITTQ